MIAMIVCNFYGWTSLSIYDTLGTEAFLDFIFEQTEVELIIFSLENLAKLIKDKRFGKLKTIRTFEMVTDSNQLQLLSDLNLKMYSFIEVLDSGKKNIRSIVDTLKSIAIDLTENDVYLSYFRWLTSWRK